MAKDSFDFYCSQAQAIGFDRGIATTSIDSIRLEIECLKKAVKFRDVDSIWYYIAFEYKYIIRKLPESQKYSLKALKAKVQTKKYIDLELDDYLFSFELKGEYKKEFRVLNKRIGDTITLWGKHFFYQNDDPSKYYYISMCRDSIKAWRAQPDLDDGGYAMMARYYLALGHHYLSHLCIRQGLKKFPKSPYIYEESGRIYLKEGKYKQSTKEYYKAASLGSETAKDFLPMTKIWEVIH